MIRTMPNLPVISVCVPVYEAHEEPNVATLAASVPDALGQHDGELVIALNGVSAEQAAVPESVVVVDLGVNRGVAPGWNAAARAARGEVLVFTNDDVVLGPDSLAVLAQALVEHRQAGVVGPDGNRWDISEAPRQIDAVDPSHLPRGEMLGCDAPSGFLMATRREVWEAVDGFDESYAPCICEDLDFCWAVRRRLGLACYAVAGVEHTHTPGVSTARPWQRIHHNGRSEMLWRIHRRNVRRFREKWVDAAEEAPSVSASSA
jgi:O-antigen biosynthesis protein